MTALTDNRDTPRSPPGPYSFPAKGGVVLFAGSFAMLTAGYAAPGAAGAGNFGLGRVKKRVDNSAGADGDKPVEIEPGVYPWINGDGITQADVGKRAYFGDDQTAYKDGAGRSYMGTIVKVDGAGVWVETDFGAVAVASAIVSSLSGNLAASSTVIVDELTNAVAADAAGLQVATATTVAPRTVLAAAMVAGGVAALDAHPRNVTITTAGVTASDAPATATITGFDIDGNALSETLTVPQTATVVTGAKCFKGTGLSVAFAAADGTGATNALGFGQIFGLSKKIKSRAGRLAVLQEIAVGAVVTTGTFATPTASPPYGSYSPSAAPDGAKDYAITYEQDLT